MNLWNRVTQIVLLSGLLAPSLAWGWGKTGHCLVGSVAAQILASDGQGMFERHRFDLCYYNNVPDVIWKAPATYRLERSEHFFDLEPILAYLASQNKSLKDLPEDRTKLSEELLKHGSAPWRVHELNQRLESLAEQLKKNQKEHRELQAQWLMVAGVLGHYVADLAQPLHCTSNYDGQLSDQKGLHEWYESIAVDKLYPELEVRVLKQAISKWPKFSKDHKDKSVFNLSLSLCQSSHARVSQVLKIDKSMGRKDAEAFAKAGRKSIEESLVAGALHLAEIWRRTADWSYDGKRFYLFEGAPNYIPSAGKPAKKPK